MIQFSLEGLRDIEGDSGLGVSDGGVLVIEFDDTGV